jgi:hypothetical protein
VIHIGWNKHLCPMLTTRHHGPPIVDQGREGVIPVWQRYLYDAYFRPSSAHMLFPGKRVGPILHIAPPNEQQDCVELRLDWTAYVTPQRLDLGAGVALYIVPLHTPVVTAPTRNYGTCFAVRSRWGYDVHINLMHTDVLDGLVAREAMEELLSLGGERER